MPRSGICSFLLAPGLLSARLKLGFILNHSFKDHNRLPKLLHIRFGDFEQLCSFYLDLHPMVQGLEVFIQSLNLLFQVVDVVHIQSLLGIGRLLHVMLIQYLLDAFHVLLVVVESLQLYYSLVDLSNLCVPFI